MKDILDSIGYALMIEIVFLPVYVILGASLLGWLGFTIHNRNRKENAREVEKHSDI